MRQYQQGYGKPIISVEQAGFRIVAVSDRIKWSRGWRWFTDFLLDHLKDCIGREWAIQAQREGSDHPVFRWLRRMTEVTQAHREAGSLDFKFEETGFLTSVFRLGYALYLIDHHDQLDRVLIKRLRSVRQFNAAYYETLIAAAFALSGARIKMAETAGQSRKTPEFWATGKSGRRYAVEAKCKSGWTAETDPQSDAFHGELRQWIRDQLYNASVKQLQNPVYCFELAIPSALEEEQWRRVHEIVKETLSEAEDITVRGQPAPAAYVMITSHAHLVNDDAVGLGQVAMLEGYRMENFRSGAQVPLETAMEWHDAHRDVMWVMRCLEEVERTPSTFDGTPPEFVAATREGRPVLRIGEKLHIDFPDGAALDGVLRDVCSSGDRAHLVVETEGGRSHIAEIPLREEEAEAARKYGDAVFGKAEKRRKRMDDPLDLYDWFLEVYGNYSREELLNQILDHPEKGRIGELPIEEMVVRVAREVTKAAMHATERGAAERPVPATEA